MAYWLIKSEPAAYGWERLVKDGETLWDGVRNNTAAINLRTMKAGDQAFFYHSVTGKEIVGVVEISQGDETLTVKQGNRLVEIGQGKDTHHIKFSDREVILDVGNDVLTIKTGNQTTQVKLGKSSTEALQGIELKVGPTSIALTPTGITLKAMTIQIEAQMMATLKGLMTNVNGDGMLKLQGGITMIG